MLEVAGETAIDVRIPIGWLMKKEGLETSPFLQQVMMIDGIRNWPIYFCQKDIVDDSAENGEG